jgi:tetratricopeptide (TPR) repeat protein
MRGTPTGPLLRALVADPHQSRAQAVVAWRAALDGADTALAARICLHQLAAHGDLAQADLDRCGVLANLDDHDRVLFTARQRAAVGDLDAAATMLRAQASPAAGEMLAELLAAAERFDEALAVCEDLWRNCGALKALQDKINILASRGDLDGAEACAARLLASGQLPAEQRRQLHLRMMERRSLSADWKGMEAVCRTALTDQAGDAQYGWGLIYAQLNQDRWDSAWASYCQLRPEVEDPGVVRAWVELHLRFGAGSASLAMATTLAARFGSDGDALAHLARLDVFSR